jgi:hypothetical protein
MNDTWIKETMELIEDLQIQKDNLESKLGSIREEILELNQQILVAESLIQTYRAKHNIVLTVWEDIKPGYFGDKTYPQILIEIAQKSGGYLKVIDAVEAMLEAEVSKDKRQIQANVYSTLQKKSKRFMRIKPGEYRLVNGLQATKVIQSSGLRETVKALKEKNPQMTRDEVLNTLKTQGFDFKGKRPANAVNITWAYLGYSKEGKQQSLLERD